jgi:hypothetical protein
MTGTPPGNMRYTVKAEMGGIKLKIPYPNAGSYQVKVDGKVVPPTPWDDEAGRQSALTKNKGCGENRFVGIENFLEFYVDAGCTVEVNPKDSIATKVRMEWTLGEFYSDGGTTRFADRMAAVLGIDVSRVKVVAVYEGSVIVDFFIESKTSSDEDASEAQSELEELTNAIKTKVASADFGAPILGVEGNGELIAGDPIPAAGAGNANYAAIVMDDNIWERYVRVQEIFDSQMEQELLEYDQPLMDVEDSEVVIEETLIVTQIQNKANDALKYSILVTIVIVLVLLLVTAVCIFRCVSAKRESVVATAKAHHVAELERQTADTQKQFNPTADDGKKMVASPGRRSERGSKARGKEDDVLSVAGSIRHSMRRHAEVGTASNRGGNSTAVNGWEDVNSNYLSPSRGVNSQAAMNSPNVRKDKKFQIQAVKEEYDDGFNDSVRPIDDSKHNLTENKVEAVAMSPHKVREN